MRKVELLTIEDLHKCANFAIERDGKLNRKQIEILSFKANNYIGTNYFWEWFVKKYGVPNYKQRGFSAGADRFSFYYFEDYSMAFKK